MRYVLFQVSLPQFDAEELYEDTQYNMNGTSMLTDQAAVKSEATLWEVSALFGCQLICSHCIFA